MNVSSHFVVRSTCIASCCAAAVFSMHLRSPIADAACWDIDMRDCCDGQRLGDPCNGETCPYVITENGEWDKKRSQTRAGICSPSVSRLIKNAGRVADVVITPNPHRLVSWMLSHR